MSDIATITIDCTGKRIEAQVLASEQINEEVPAVDQTNDPSSASAPLAASTNGDHVTTIEVSNDEKPQGNGECKTNENGDDSNNADGKLVLETVGELRQYIGDKLEVDKDTAKIIHRGKLIGTNADERLSTLRFRNKDVIRVMGTPVKVDPGFWALRNYEQGSLVKLNKTFADNGADLDLLERNFLDGKDRNEMIKKTEKTLKSFNLVGEKHLEEIDLLKIYDDNTSEEQKTRNREKRKQLVNGILNLLNLNDKYLHRLEDYKFRTEHPDEGR